MGEAGATGSRGYCISLQKIRDPRFIIRQKRNNHCFSVHSESSSYAFMQFKGTSGPFVLFHALYVAIKLPLSNFPPNERRSTRDPRLASSRVNVTPRLWARPVATPRSPARDDEKGNRMLTKMRGAPYAQQTLPSHCCYPSCPGPFYLCLIEHYIKFSLPSTIMYTPSTTAFIIIYIHPWRR